MITQVGSGLFSNMLSYLQFALTAALSLDVAAGASQFCKPIPGGPRWPAVADWNTLNDTIDGRLIKPVPPGAVCQPSSPTYDNVTCASLSTGPALWTSSEWHAKDPVSPNYNDDTCLPEATAPCSADRYPAYVVNATTAAHVQAGVSFAKRTGVRLIVKATGHDWPGRSSGPGSMSIWTHYMKRIETMRGDKRALAYGAPAAVKLSAGIRAIDVLNAMADEQLTVMTGADLHVGIMGWTTNGGHGPLTSIYGLGADQVLEMEVVTPDGEYRVVNEQTYPDLFWALRGGGGSTFGVVLSITVKAYYKTTISEVTFAYNTTGNSDTYWTLAAYFNQQVPYLNDNGAMGYYFAFPFMEDPTASNQTQTGKVVGAWVFPNKSAEDALAIMKPMEDHIKAADWGDSVSVLSFPIANDAGFNSEWATMLPQSVGSDGRLGSWLLGKEGLSHNLSTLSTALRAADGGLNFPTLGHVVAGQGVRNANVPGGSNAVLPAWRDAYVHLVVIANWPYLNATARIQLGRDLRDTRVPAIKALQPNSGAYINEADPTNEAWKHDYYGSNYERLLGIKHHWDPTGVFWCKPCVGWDEWEVQNWTEDGEGIGQDVKRLCRKR